MATRSWAVREEDAGGDCWEHKAPVSADAGRGWGGVQTQGPALQGPHLGAEEKERGGAGLEEGSPQSTAEPGHRCRTPAAGGGRGRSLRSGDTHILFTFNTEY